MWGTALGVGMRTHYNLTTKLLKLEEIEVAWSTVGSPKTFWNNAFKRNCDVGVEDT